MVIPHLVLKRGFQPNEISALIHRPIVELHASEAAFLWTQRDDAVFAPQYSVRDLAILDQRVEANIEGLRVAGTAGWEIAAEALVMEGPGEVFTASSLAFGNHDRERIRTILDAGCCKPDLNRGLISGLGWVAFEKVRPHLHNLLASENYEIQRAGLAGFAVHRRHPGSPLVNAMTAPNDALRSAALKAAGLLGDTHLLREVEAQLKDKNPVCQFSSAWAAARLGNHSYEVLTLLKMFATGGGQYATRALDLAMRCLRLSDAKAWRTELRESTTTIRLAIIASGVIGDPDYVDDLIQLMGDRTTARVAGEAFSMITGAALAYEDLDMAAPKDFLESVGDEPEHEDGGRDPDRDLPWPMPERVAAWWLTRKSKFESGVRYLRGNKITDASLLDALANGMQRQRAAAALEMAVRKPNQPLFEVRARGDWQLRSITAWSL